MKLSHNILVIDNMIMDTVRRMYSVDDIMKMECTLSIKVMCMCPVTGNNFETLEVETTGRGVEMYEPQRNAVQDFLLGRFSNAQMVYYDVEAKCTSHRGINALQVNLREPYKSFFEDLFDNTNWQMPQKTIGC